MLEQHTWPGNVLEKERTDSSSETSRLQNSYSAKKSARQSYPVHFPSTAAKEESYAIMRVLQKAGRQKTLFVGRSDLQQQLQTDFGLSLSFSQIKGRLDYLRSFGLIGAKKGKGHHLLPAGNDYLLAEA